MNSVKNMDFKIRNVLFYSLISTAVNEEIGILSASGVTQNQGWLVWLNGSQGVYDLFSLPNEHDNAASYLLKYYPSPDEEAFSCFSEEEKQIRKSHLFENGAPKHGDRETTMVDHFIIGAVDILWEDKSIWLHLNVREDGNQVRKPELPVVQMSHNFYSFLLRALSFLTKTPPSLVLTRITTNDHGETNRQFATILLPGEMDKTTVIPDLCQTIGVKLDGAVTGENETALWEPLYLESAVSKTAQPSPFVDPLWWTLPSKAETILAEDLKI